MEDPPARSAHEAYRRFFEAFNSRSPGAWAGALHFPHVRVAPKGPIRVIDTVAEHIAGMSWDAVDATGWDHTVEVEPEIVHSGPSRVHIAGGWTRFTKANQPILSTRVTYIVTNVQGDWAIQSRFAVDGGDGNEAEAASERVARVYLDEWNARRFTGAATWLNYPAVQVHPGRLVTWNSPVAHAEWLQAQPWRAISLTSTRVVQSGANACSLALTLAENGTSFESLILVTRRDGHWGFQGESTMEREVT